MRLPLARLRRAWRGQADSAPAIAAIAAENVSAASGADNPAGPEDDLNVPPLPRRDPKAAKPFKDRTDWKPTDPAVLGRILDALNQQLQLAREPRHKFAVPNCPKAARVICWPYGKHHVAGIS